MQDTAEYVKIAGRVLLVAGAKLGAAAGSTMGSELGRWIADITDIERLIRNALHVPVEALRKSMAESSSNIRVCIFINIK